MTAGRFAVDGLTAYVESILRGLDARPGDARRVAESLVASDRAGHASHGVRQLPYYAGQIRAGEIDVTSEIEVVDDQGALIVLDGHHGFGHVRAFEATRLAVERARRARVAAVGLRHANHIGRLGEYTELVAEGGQLAILLATCEGSGQQLAPFGGLDRRLTNNPISFAAPGDEHPIVFDMALSAVAESRVLQAAESGTAIPDGWVFDRDGEATTDPAAYVDGGTLVPVGGPAGGHKGYALAVLVELIVGVLARTSICGPQERPFSNAYTLIVIDPGDGARHDELTGFVEWLKSSRLRRGAGEVLVPGEIEQRARHANRSSVPLDGPTVELLGELAASLAIGRGLDEHLVAEA